MMMGMEEEVDKKLADGAFMCCCCLCQCTDKRVKDLTCCCFFPIRCGVLFIACFILLVTLLVFLEIFYQLLNDDIHWWYVLIGVILAIFLIIASAFAITFLTNDTEASRSRLWTGCLFVIFGVSLIAIWSTIYFVFLYKKENVTSGNDGVGFLKVTRKQEVVFVLFFAFVIDAIFAYFICVVDEYQTAMKEEPEEEKMDEMMDDKKMDDMMMMMDGEMM